MMLNNHFFGGENIGPYSTQLKCNSAAWLDKKATEVDRGGKIILPQAALMHLTRLNIQFPMLFKITNKKCNKVSHCGVLEFVAPEGKCFLPYWMMKNLLLNENDMVFVEYVNLPIARFAKFQPQSVDFLEISNPKAVLENSLRNFATLTKDDIISIHYNDKEYELCVLETRPGNAVSIIECDMDVDFAAPVGYKEPDYKKKEETDFSYRSDYQRPNEIKNNAPYGEGYRLDGKKAKQITTDQQASINDKNKLINDRLSTTRGVPNYNYEIGTLTFIRSEINSNNNNQKPDEVVKPKEITGQKLKHIGVKPPTQKS